MFLTDDGRIALIKSRHGEPHHGADAEERLLQLLLAIGESRGEEAADVLVQMGPKG